MIILLSVTFMSKQSIWNFQIPTRIIFGEGCLDQIGKITTEFGAKKALIITGRKAMRCHGVIDRMINLLEPIEAHSFEEVEPNPSFETIENAIRVFKEQNCDIVIGLGGGSPLDVAKVVAALSKKEKTIAEFFIPPIKIESKDFPMIAVPSTSGTGSEATPFSVATDTEKRVKKVATHHLLFPETSLVDPSICKTMPKDVIAQTGLDAISHAIEAYWAKRAQPITDTIALDALRHIFSNFRIAYQDSENSIARSEMALGSLEGGMALSNTFATASHAISFPLTAKYDIPHGLAVALTLPLFLEFNAPSIPIKISGLLNVMNVKSIKEASKFLTKLMKDIGQPTRLSELGIGKDDIPWIIENGFTPSRVANNPREVKAKDVEDILMEIL